MRITAAILSSLLAAPTCLGFVAPSKKTTAMTSSTRKFGLISGDIYSSEPEPEVDPRRKNPDEKPAAPPVRMPVIDTGNGQMDVISRLLRDRILLLGQQVDDEVANVLVAQLLYLANEDPTKDITLYINSPGGSVSAGMAIYDTMQYVPCDVSTVCFGTAASMGAFLLGAGAKGKRRALPNARIMIHQPLGGAQGQASDIEIQAKEILFIREVLNTYIADYCGQPKDKIEEDCDRDFFMTAEEALDYGIIDEVVSTKTSHVTKPPMPANVIIGGYDPDLKKHELYMVEPSGVSYQYYGCAAGKGKQACKTEMEKLPLNYTNGNSDGITVNEAVKHLAKMVLMLYEDKEESKKEKLELEFSWICEESKFEHVSVPAEVVAEAKTLAEEEIAAAAEEEDDSEDDDEEMEG